MNATHLTHEQSNAQNNAQRIVEAVADSHLTLAKAPRGAAAAVDPTGSIMASWGRNATPLTVFRIASMTKSFTAALVLMLRDEGDVSLDIPIASLAPECGSIVGPGSDPAAITLRRLLTMSSGLATDDPWADRHLDATDDDLDGWVQSGLTFAHPTGTEFEYSNLGYALIGRVVHRVTGQRLQTLVRDLLLTPLSMSHTAWSPDDLPPGTDVANGLHPVGDELVAESPLADGVVAPMGGLWSCTADLCRWMAILSSAFCESPLDAPISPRSRREMQQLHRETAVRRLTANDGSLRVAEGGYAMGLTTYFDERYGRIVTHSGGLPGYGSNMRWVPGGIGVVALANITYAPMWHAGAALLDALGVAGLTGRSAPVVPVALTDSAARLAALLGSWNDDAAKALFADNVLADIPAPLRQAEANRHLPPAVSGFSRAGRVLSVDAHGAAAATMTLLANDTLHRIRFELAPIAPVQIQKYDWL